MKKYVILIMLTVMLMTFASVEALSADIVNIEDNEKGWVNDEIRFNGTDWLNNSVYTIQAETAPYDIDGDSFSLAWNYSMNAAVNSKQYDYIEKNLEKPLTGGNFSMSLWIRSGAGTDANGYKVEIIAYEPNGTAHSIKTSNALSVSGSAPADKQDNGWHNISAELPANKKIIKMGIKLHNGNSIATAWGILNIDNIQFTNTQIAQFTRIDETGWLTVERTSESPTVANGTLQYYYEGSEVIVISGGLTPDLEYLKSISMAKTLDSAIKGGFIEYKVYVDAFNSSLNGSSHTKTKMLAYDASGNKYDLNAETRLKYGAFLSGGMIFGGWNQFRAELPADVDVTKIEIQLFWYENGGMGSVPYYVDDIKVMDNDIPQPETTEPNPQTGNTQLIFVLFMTILVAGVIVKRKEYNI